jgi:hypothetical protein
VSTVSINGLEEYDGIPNGSWVTVSSLPSKRIVSQFFDVNDSIAMNLDPGKYEVMVKWDDPSDPSRCIKYIYDFLHEMEDYQWDNASRLHAREAKFMLTSYGPRWECKMGYGCKKKTNSEIAMVIHECVDHLKMTKDELFSGDDQTYSSIVARAEKYRERQEKENSAAKQLTNVADGLKRPRGRPRKN